MSILNSQLTDALVEALDELYNAEDSAHADMLISVINEIRDDLNIIMMTDLYVETHVWGSLRKQTSFIQTLMSTTATFIQGIDDVDAAIKKFVTAFIPFTAKTKIVDNETITKATEHHELEATLVANYWLFFLLYAATNKRIVNRFIATLIPQGKGGKNGA